MAVAFSGGDDDHDGDGDDRDDRDGDDDDDVDRYKIDNMRREKIIFERAFADLEKDLAAQKLTVSVVSLLVLPHNQTVH